MLSLSFHTPNILTCTADIGFQIRMFLMGTQKSKRWIVEEMKVRRRSRHEVGLRGTWHKVGYSFCRPFGKQREKGCR